MACGRGDQPIEQTRGFDLIAPAERLDDTLHVAATLTGVLDEVEVLVGSNLLDADKHGAAPCSRHQHHDSVHLRKHNLSSLLK